MPEVWFPGSKDPFRPMNPHGRAMPKPVRQARPELYQVVVKRAGWGEIPFGPKMVKECVEEFFRVVDGAIRSGVEKRLSDPHIVKCV